MRHCSAFRDIRFYHLPLLLALFFSSILATPAPARAQVRVVVDDTPILFEGQPPVEQGGRILVPLRGVLERLGAFVRYDGQTKTVIAIRGSTNITLPVGSRRALIGDRPVTLDAPAFIANGSVLVPLRFISEALGAQVTWDEGTRTVTIHTQGGTSAPVDITTTGTVTAVYPDLTPRRLVVRAAGQSGAPEKTIPLAANATVSVRRPNTLLAITLDRVNPGDTVEVRQTPEGVGTAVEVVARASAGAEPPRTPNNPAGPAPQTPGNPEPPRNPTRPQRPNRPARPPQNATENTVFKGEFLEASRISPGRWVLKMTDGRLIEVPDKVLVLYGGEKITVDDLRSGDQLTIAVDPKTKTGTRVVVAVEQ